MNKTSFNKLALGLFATVIYGTAQVTLAHTGIKDSPTEGQRTYTAFTITHGCNNSAGTEKKLPVVAQSAVFPNNTDSEAFAIDPDTGDESPIDLANHIVGAIGGPSLRPTMIQDRNIFKKQVELTDGIGKVRGMAFTSGKLDTTALGLVPFRLNAPRFIDSSCAKSLKLRVAVANYCSKTKNTNKDNRADIWIGVNTPLFDDDGVMPNGHPDRTFWPTMTVKRDLANNPIDESCGDGFDIAVQPSAADIDEFLPIKGYWPQ